MSALISMVDRALTMWWYCDVMMMLWQILIASTSANYAQVQPGTMHNQHKVHGLCSEKCIPVIISQVYFDCYEAWGREVIPFPLPKYCHVLSTNLEREGVLRTTASTGRYDSPREVSKLHAHWFWQQLHASCKTRTPGQLIFLVLWDRSESFWLDALSPKFNGPSNQTGTVLKWSNVSYLWC